MHGFINGINSDFAVYFKVFGTNSNHITRWLFDNIQVTVTCKPAKNLTYALTGNIVTLTWDHPCDSLLNQNPGIVGFNIYRTDQTGQPPYVKLNNAQIPAEQYTDTLPSIGQNGHYRYFVTTVYTHPTMNPSCEPGSDTLLVVTSLGIDSYNKDFFVLSPNPGNGLFTLRMLEPAESFEVFNIQGMTIMQEPVPNGLDIKIIDLSGYQNGIYFLRVNNARKTYVSKIIKI